MTIDEVKAVLKQILDAKYIIFVTMILTGVLDLIGIPKSDFGAGFVLGFLFLVGFGVRSIVSKKK